ncbi:MAG TPA: tetratricopeptide repeat protein [Rhodocyclaceae bacterium]|nr:tetratricopeptide repeat protein [Rhodocyclaceae bacterium]
MNKCGKWRGASFTAGVVTLFLSMSPTALAQSLGPAVCGPLENTFGPYDYRTNKDKLPIVERFHFTPDVENLRKGASTNRIGGDISYTLRAFPNHTRALLAMSRLAQREKTNSPKGSTYSVDCWFERALRFRPDDAEVRMTNGIYLAQTGRKAEAAKMLEGAAKLGESGANFHYNMGLVYADLGRYDEALAHAHKAYALGFALPGLKNKLQRAGKWRDAPAS